MFVTFDDPKTGEEREYEFDLDDIDVTQTRYIKRHFQLTPAALSDGIAELDVDALVATYWLMLNQNGIAIDPAKVNFKILKFGKALVDARLRERAQELGLQGVDELRELADEAERNDTTVEDLLAARRGEENPTEAGSPTTKK